MTHTPTEIAAMIERLGRKIFENDGYHGVSEVDLNPDGPDAAAMLRDVAAERDALLSGGGLSENKGFNELYEEIVQLSFEAGTAQGTAEAERDRLAAMVEKLRGYAVHDDDCGVNALLMPRLPLTKQCTCGLSDVLKESENG